MTIKQIYNARSAFRSSISGNDLKMQHLMKLLERDQYIHWYRIKDEDVVHDRQHLENKPVQTSTARFCLGDTDWDDILYRFCICGG